MRCWGSATCCPFPRPPGQQAAAAALLAGHVDLRSLRVLPWEPEAALESGCLWCPPRKGWGAGQPFMSSGGSRAARLPPAGAGFPEAVALQGLWASGRGRVIYFTVIWEKPREATSAERAFGCSLFG